MASAKSEKPAEKDVGNKKEEEELDDDERDLVSVHSGSINLFFAFGQRIHRYCLQVCIIISSNLKVACLTLSRLDLKYFIAVV